MRLAIFTLSEDGVVQARQTGFLASFTLQRVIKLFLTGWIIPTAVLIVLFIVQKNLALIIAIKIAAAIILVALVSTLCIIGLTYLSIPRSARKTFHQRKALREEMTMSWTDEEMEVTGGFGISRHAWREFVKWTESNRFVLLFLDDNMHMILPKSAFSLESLADLRTLLHRASIPKVGALGLRVA